MTDEAGAVPKRFLVDVSGEFVDLVAEELQHLLQTIYHREGVTITVTEGVWEEDESE